ncbi:transposase [Verrucomicrobiaceae bacterium 227]
MKSQASNGDDQGGSREWTPLELAEVKTPRRIGSIWQAKGAASRRRVKFEDQTTCYHVMSRTVNGEFLFGPTEKEAFRRMMWRMSAFSGVEVLTYVVMDNHFHILAKVPDRAKWLRKFEGEGGEARLLTHLGAVYSKKFLEQLQREIATFREQGNERAVEELLTRFKKRFCDISLFVKELKERFSRWFNKQNGRRGTLWMDRFKSVLVDGEAALATMSAYIDLNPVRAGIVEDPMLYEWSGYGEAMGGSRRARRGLCKSLNLPQDLWESRGMARYRLFLYDEGVLVEPTSESLGKGRKSRRGFKLEARAKVVEERGEVESRTNLRKRVTSFSQGVAVGGKDFVKGVAARYRKTLGRKNERRPRSLDGGEAGIFVMRE